MYNKLYLKIKHHKSALHNLNWKFICFLKTPNDRKTNKTIKLFSVEQLHLEVLRPLESWSYLSARDWEMLSCKRSYLGNGIALNCKGRRRCATDWTLALCDFHRPIWSATSSWVCLDQFRCLPVHAIIQKTYFKNCYAKQNILNELTFKNV